MKLLSSHHHHLQHQQTPPAAVRWGHLWLIFCVRDISNTLKHTPTFLFQIFATHQPSLLQPFSLISHSPLAGPPVSLTCNEESSWCQAVKAKATANSPNSDVTRERGKFGRTGEVRTGTPDKFRLGLESRLFRCDGDKDAGKIKRMFSARREYTC